MKFQIEIDCDNAAFDPDHPHGEIVRILTEITNYIAYGGIDLEIDFSKNLLDINGNSVGKAVCVK